MNAAQLALWQKIEAFQVNQPGTRFTFEDRLARENRWTPAFARRVVGEYKRFLLLAMVAEHPVTPSDEVDQAWHLHMVYTRSYWEDLCGKVLPRPLHHGPTRGGHSETIKFTNLYELTLDSYRRVFGETPPEDVWPATRVRFGRAPNFQRVNTAENWVIPRPRLTPARLVAISLVTLSLAGAGMALGSGTLGQQGTSPVLIGVGIVVLFATLGGAAFMSYRAAKKAAARRDSARPADGTSGCSHGFFPIWMGGGGGSGDKGHKGEPGNQDGPDGPESGGNASGNDAGGNDSGGSDGGGGSDSGGSGCGGGGCGGGGCGGS